MYQLTGRSPLLVEIINNLKQMTTLDDQLSRAEVDVILEAVFSETPCTPADVLALLEIIAGQRRSLSADEEALIRIRLDQLCGEPLNPDQMLAARWLAAEADSSWIGTWSEKNVEGGRTYQGMRVLIGSRWLEPDSEGHVRLYRKSGRMPAGWWERWFGVPKHVFWRPVTHLDLIEDPEGRWRQKLDAPKLVEIDDQVARQKARQLVIKTYGWFESPP